MTRYDELQRKIRRLRQRIFHYYDQSEEKGQQASRILERYLVLAAQCRPSATTDRWGSTANDRRQLARRGIVWGD